MKAATSLEAELKRAKVDEIDESKLDAPLTFDDDEPPLSDNVPIEDEPTSSDLTRSDLTRSDLTRSDSTRSDSTRSSRFSPAAFIGTTLT